MYVELDPFTVWEIIRKIIFNTNYNFLKIVYLYAINILGKVMCCIINISVGKTGARICAELLRGVLPRRMPILLWLYSHTQQGNDEYVMIDFLCGW